MKLKIDAKEKMPWDLSIYGFESEKCSLTTGDYTVEGLEEILVIERKRSTGEISLNLGRLAKQFEAELQRMQEFRFSYLICEFSSDDLAIFPKKSGIPKRMWKSLRMNGIFMLKRLNDWCEKYGVELIFCNNRTEAEKVASDIINEIKQVLDEEQETN